jgi:hypothetical protein
MRILPDVEPEDGVQPEPQFSPPHVRDTFVPFLATGIGDEVLGCGVVKEVLGCGVVELVLDCAEKTLHSPSKPRAVPISSDAKATLRKPVVDTKTSFVLRDPVGSCTISEHEALLHRETMLH